MLQIQALHKSFGGQDVLAGASFAASPRERVGLVGRNGSGKTTLLRILSGQEAADRGEVVIAPGCQVGCLDQEGQLEGRRTLYQEMARVFEGVAALERRLRSLEEEVASLEGPALEQALALYGRLQARFEHAEPHTMDARIRKVLRGIGFSEADLERPCQEFSGGWQMRGAMARLLLQEPDLLLLDEPTNHLDLEAVEWFEGYLEGYPGAVLIVSHDRHFLDRVVSRIVELSAGAVEEYAGHYTYYLEERARRQALYQAAYDQQQRKLAQERRFVERFRFKATLASRVQSRIKQIEKRTLLEAPEEDLRALRASFTSAPPSGREVFRLKRIRKAYQERPVLQDLDLEVERGERLALVGPNGAGKSTLLRLLAGLERPDEGSLQVGSGLAPVYYAQHQAEALDPDRTLLEEATAACPGAVDPTRVRTVLGSLLFEGETVHKRIGVLSGGERSRVALARCVLTPSNLLLLDEPTNHLDLESRDALLEALSGYPGTVIMVTHDRHLMNELATSILEVRDGRATRYLGGYRAYREKKRQLTLQEEARGAQTPARRAGPSKTASRPTPRPAAPRSIPWKLEALEKKIYELEAEAARWEAALGDPEVYSDPARAREAHQRYQAASRQRDELTRLWDEMTEPPST